MEMVIEQIIQEYKTGLKQIYGGRLCGVYIYGSYVRGEQSAGSDLDILIVLNEIDQYGKEIERTSRLTSDLSLKHGITISRVILPAADWLQLDTPLLRNIRAEGLPV
jgi:predicted nucleotidyltransferase